MAKKLILPTLDDGEPRASKSIGDDLIWGAEAIADEISLPVSRVFYHLSAGHLPARKMGGLWVASRRKLREHLLGEGEGDAA